MDINTFSIITNNKTSFIYLGQISILVTWNNQRNFLTRIITVDIGRQYTIVITICEVNPIVKEIDKFK